MNFQRKIISVLLVILMAVLTVIGGNKGIQMPEEDEITAWYTRSDTIYFWYSDPEMTDYIDKAAVDFGEANNVHVFPMLITVDNYIETLNQASVHNDQMPDAYIIDNESLEMVYQTGLATAIDDASGVCTTENFPQSALDAVTYDGKLVGYPLSYDTCVLLYNKDYLQQWAQEKALAILKGDADSYVVNDYLANAGATLEEADQSEWTTDDEDEDEADSQDDYYVIDSELVPYDELSEEEQATALAGKTDEVYADALPKTLNELLTISDTFNAPEGAEEVMKWDVSDIFYNFWIVGDVVNMGGASGDDRNSLKFNNEATTNCLKYYQYLNSFFFIEADQVEYDSVFDDFKAGKMLFTIVSSEAVSELYSAKADGEIDFEYGFAMLPDVDENTKSRPMSTTTAVVVNGYSEKKELANAFAKYITCDYASELYARTGKLSANIHANAAYENLSVFDEEYANSIPLPKIIELENFWMELEAVFARIWDGADIETEMEELDNTLDLLVL